MVSHLSAAASDLVAHELRHFAVRAAKNRQACRILCRLMERRPVFFGGESLGKMVIFRFWGAFFFGWIFVVGVKRPPGPKVKQWESEDFCRGPMGLNFVLPFLQKKNGRSFVVLVVRRGIWLKSCWVKLVPCAFTVMRTMWSSPSSSMGRPVGGYTYQCCAAGRVGTRNARMFHQSKRADLSWTYLRSYIPRLLVQKMANIYNIYVYIYCIYYIYIYVCMYVCMYVCIYLSFRSENCWKATSNAVIISSTES